MATLRKVFRLERVLTVTQFENLGKLLAPCPSCWGYFYFSEFLTVWYNREPGGVGGLPFVRRSVPPALSHDDRVQFRHLPSRFSAMKRVRRSIPALSLVLPPAS